MDVTMSSSEEEGFDTVVDYVDDHPEDNERIAIRSQLTTLSFEELQKLKEKVGAKVYKEALFGQDTKKTHGRKPQVFKRDNKNRPREMSSKKPVSMIREWETGKMKIVKKTQARDPRFDPLCGEFDKKQFSADYNFLCDIRLKDIKTIRSELKETEDPERQVQLRRLLQRLTEQHRVSKKKKIEGVKRQTERAQMVHDVSEGRQQWKNKSERRVEELVKQYEELKNEGSGRIQRHLKRRQQKVKRRSHRAPVDV